MQKGCKVQKTQVPNKIECRVCSTFQKIMFFQRIIIYAYLKSMHIIRVLVFNAFNNIQFYLFLSAYRIIRLFNMSTPHKIFNKKMTYYFNFLKFYFRSTSDSCHPVFIQVYIYILG